MTEEVPPPAASPQLPVAETRTRHRRWWLAVVPLLALIGAGWMLYDASRQRGTPIQIRFENGHGLKAGDVVKFRGIIVGEVERLDLAEDLEHLTAKIRIARSARGIAREGSKFWIVRPQLSIGGAAGLDTVVGAKYLSVLPGAGALANQFVGLEEPPMSDLRDSGGLEIVVTGPTAGGLRPGAPVSYRQVAIGKVLSMDLAKDAGGVETRLIVAPQYASLIRDNSVFWKFSGASLTGNIFSGLEFDVGSMHSLLLGGIAVATPPSPGPQAAMGHRFPLYEAAQESWRGWNPHLPLHRKQSSALDFPRPVPVVMRWKEGGFFGAGPRQRGGWLTSVPEGLMGPIDLITRPKDAEDFSFEIRGTAFTNALPAATDNVHTATISEAVLQSAGISIGQGWETSTMRVPDAPEDVLLLVDADREPKLLKKEYFYVRNRNWRVQPSVQLDAGWHGASVIADRDQKLIGVLRFQDGAGKVIPLSK